MKCLCSDKTGTLTTAKMTVYYDDNAKCFNGFSAKEVLEFASLASNEANKDDPIDSAVLRAYAESTGFTREEKDAHVQKAVDARKKKYVLDENGFVGFNPIVKRTCCSVTHVNGTKYFCSKGMVDVILKTDPNDEGIQWTVDNFAAMEGQAKKADADLGISGFKTLAVMVSKNGGPKVFAGILPIMDPPRSDTKETIAKIKEAMVAVKMITGDHHNIGKELARQIELGTDIRTPDQLHSVKEKSAEQADMILKADGFAKVKPMDKHLVVDTLMDTCKLVVGMTGDGVNDAPALAKAQIGIAVDGATDAAKSAGDIVLTREGLSPIYTAIQISRRIFKRLKSYVIYRICITVQVVFFLAALALFYDLRFKALYIILLALFHDLQIVTIAYDHQVAEKRPETPTVLGLLLQSYAMGILMFVQTMILVAKGDMFLSDEYAKSKKASKPQGEMDEYMETCIFLQVSNSSAILILSARTVGFFFTTAPAWQLAFSTAIGQVLINLWVLYPLGKALGLKSLISQLAPQDVGMIWLYDVCWLLILDIVKMVAGALWEKLKSPDIDKNPALSAQARKSRRVSNNLMPATHGAVLNETHKKRISQKITQKNR